MIIISSRQIVIPIIITAVLAVIAGCFLFLMSITVLHQAKFTPRQNSCIKKRNPLILVHWKQLLLGNIELVKVLLDGKNLTESAELKSDEVVIKFSNRLSDGPHYVSVKIKYKLIVSRVVNLKWKFDVDTQAPRIDLGVDEVLGSRESKTEISGLTEPGTELKVTLNGTRLIDPTVYGGGTFFLPVDLGMEDNILKLKAKDQAGNKAYRKIRIVIDREPPVILGMAPVSKKNIKTATPEIEATIGEKDSEVKKICFKVNGQKVQGYYDRLSAKAKADIIELAEGKNDIELEAEDTAGNKASAKWACLVDSSEEFGKRTIVEGAVGADVKELQARIIMHGFDIGKPTASYDAGMTQAVKRLQNDNGLPISGIVGPEELRILKPQKLDTSQVIPNARIVIEISRRALQLYSGTELIKVYPIAVGKGGRFKTPVGKHRIRKKIVNPTWYPPAWAGISHPISPGPNNPLGNREMKLSVSGYSIHGTNRPTSIGSAATHGCIRMYPSDVLEMFEVVNVGTPVEIRS